MFKYILILCMVIYQLNSSELYLVGEDGKLNGCIMCSKYNSDSIWNKYGTYGSKYDSDSIWNKYGTYGSKYTTISPWNKYGDGMKIVDLDGKFYGYFTINRYSNQTNVPLLKSILDAYINNEWESLEEFRDWVAPQIR